MFKHKKKIQLFFRFLSIVFLISLVANLYIYHKAEAQANVITVQDGMGTTYQFTTRSGRVYYELQAWQTGYVMDSGDFPVDGDNITAAAGDNVAFAVYIYGGQLQVIALSNIPHPISVVGKIITVDVNLESFDENQVNVFDVRKFGIYVSWVKNGKQYYAIIDRWHGLREEGTREQYEKYMEERPWEGRKPLPPIGGALGECQSEITAPVSGESIVIVLDSSGSMSGTKIITAKKQIRSLLRWRVGGNDEVALFIFTGCGEVPLIQGFTQDEQKIIKGLDAATAEGGRSPVAESIRVGRQYLESCHNGKKGKLYLYSDGGENCEGDPVAAAREVKESEFNIGFKIKGYNVSSEDKRELTKIQRAAEGLFSRPDFDHVWDKHETKKTAREAGANAVSSGIAALGSFLLGGGLNPIEVFRRIFGTGGIFK